MTFNARLIAFLSLITLATHVKAENIALKYDEVNEEMVDLETYKTRQMYQNIKKGAAILVVIAGSIYLFDKYGLEKLTSYKPVVSNHVDALAIALQEKLSLSLTKARKFIALALVKGAAFVAPSTTTTSDKATEEKKEITVTESKTVETPEKKIDTKEETKETTSSASSIDSTSEVKTKEITETTEVKKEIKAENNDGGCSI